MTALAITNEDTIRRMGQALWRGAQWAHEIEGRRVLYHTAGFRPADIRQYDEEAYRLFRVRVAVMGGQ